jgi:hypothetical protein
MTKKLALETEDNNWQEQVTPTTPSVCFDTDFWLQCAEGGKRIKKTSQKTKQAGGHERSKEQKEMEKCRGTRKNRELQKSLKTAGSRKIQK